MSSLLAEHERIRILNDHLRCLHRGGMVVISRGIAAMRREVWAEVILAVARFEAFTPDNDPYGEHDCAVVDTGCKRHVAPLVRRMRLMWQESADR
nr:DUF3768 domain-containing protein [Mesorhizobium sp.]